MDTGRLAADDGGVAPLPPTPMWLAIGHGVLVTLYLVVPLAMIVLAWRRKAWRKDLVATLVVGFSIGVGFALAYAHLVGGSVLRVRPGEAVLAGWLAVSLLAFIKLIDLGTARLAWLPLGRLVRGRQSHAVRSARAVRTMCRVVALLLVGMPLLAAATMVYRPKVVPVVVPPTDYEAVRFDAADGTTIAAWYLPARRPSTTTVLVVPGLGSGKADALPVALAFVDAGYNVLAIDPRAHGESDGHLTSFGDRGRLDVHAARRWLAEARPEAGASVYGLGISMGGAALLSSQADFDALAVIDTFDDLGALADAVIGRQFAFIGPLRWLSQRTIPTLVSLHSGRPMERFRPADYAAEAWPTPLLVVHSREDDLIPFAAGRRLYDVAAAPKQSFWPRGLSHQEVFTDPAVLSEVAAFFAKAATWQPIVRAEALR